MAEKLEINISERFLNAKFGTNMVLTWEATEDRPGGISSGGDLLELLDEFCQIIMSDEITELQNPRSKQYVLIDQTKGTLLSTLENSFLNGEKKLILKKHIPDPLSFKDHRLQMEMKTTKIFFDCEFTGLHQKTTLISIGFISECGKTFYAEFNDYDKTQIDEWLQKNVIDKLKFKDPASTLEDNHYIATRVNNPPPSDLYNSFSLEMRDDTSVIAHQLLQWLEQFAQIEIWSDCLSFDWVLFCNLFGHAFKIPENVYYIPFDICTLFKAKGIDPDIDRNH